MLTLPSSPRQMCVVGHPSLPPSAQHSTYCSSLGRTAGQECSLREVPWGCSAATTATAAPCGAAGGQAVALLLSAAAHPCCAGLQRLPVYSLPFPHGCLLILSAVREYSQGSSLQFTESPLKPVLYMVAAR